MTVTTNAEVIRSERYAEIGTIVQRDGAILIDFWAKRAAEEQPNARRVHHSVLLDDMSSFLWELGEHLASSGDADASLHRRSARQHGEQRWVTGWSLTEVIRDYRIMRLVVLEYLDVHLDRPLRLREIQAVGLALDEAIEASVDRYVRSSEQQHRQLEESLREADRRKNEFLATLAHELRNPLAPLRNSLESIRLRDDSPTVFRQVRELMDRQVQQMSRLVDDLLDVTRIAQGKLVLRKEVVEVGPTIAQAVQSNAPLREAHHHRFSVSLPPAPLCVVGDPCRLVQVLVNLLNNATKYTPDGGEIRIEAVREGGDVVIRVKDNGVGIPPEKLSQIFDLFTQLDHGPERTQGGLGIGLTLVRRLVELHGGSITATSLGVGKGSEFIIRLPAAVQGQEAANPRPVGPTPGGGRHVLIVEDNHDARESLAMLLELFGHRVDVAEDGLKGMEAIIRLRPEIALVDLAMPGMDGYEVARRVRAALGDDVVLVALTGFGLPEDRQKAIEAGFNAFLIKPVEVAALQQLLSTHTPLKS